MSLRDDICISDTIDEPLSYIVVLSSYVYVFWYHTNTDATKQLDVIVYFITPGVACICFMIKLLPSPNWFPYRTFHSITIMII